MLNSRQCLIWKRNDTKISDKVISETHSKKKIIYEAKNWFCSMDKNSAVGKPQIEDAKKKYRALVTM